MSTDSLASVTSFLCIPGFVTLFQGQRAETHFPLSSQNSSGKMKALQILLYVTCFVGFAVKGVEDKYLF